MKKLELPHYWICFICATDRGGVWPEGHVATCAIDKCQYCDEDGSLAPIVDFNWPDRDLSSLRD